MAEIKVLALDLGSAHAVADEQEDVLGFLEQAQQAVLLVGCGIRIRLCCVCGNGCSSHHADGRSSCAKLEKAAAGDLVFFHDVVLSFHSIKHCGPASGPVFPLVGTLLL